MCSLCPTPQQAIRVLCAHKNERREMTQGEIDTLLQFIQHVEHERQYPTPATPAVATTSPTSPASPPANPTNPAIARVRVWRAAMYDRDELVGMREYIMTRGYPVSEVDCGFDAPSHAGFLDLDIPLSVLNDFAAAVLSATGRHYSIDHIPLHPRSLR